MKLKACPHCGEPGLPQMGEGGGCWVDCQNHCAGNVYATHQDAARAWNQRKRAKKAEPTPE